LGVGSGAESVRTFGGRGDTWARIAGTPRVLQVLREVTVSDRGEGGMLLAVWDARRATVDGDFLARNLGVDEPTVLARMVEIASAQPLVEDGVEYLVNTARATTIRDGDLYGGVRVSTDATVAGARVKLRLDVSTGDPVIPPPDVISYPTLRPHHPGLRILGYPLVGLAAEFAANDLLDIVEAFGTQRDARGRRPGVDQSRISGPRVLNPVRDSLAGVRRFAVAGVGKLFG
jgi:hypothetical protein